MTDPDAVKVEVVDHHPALPVTMIIKAMVVGFTFAIIIPVALVLYLNHQDTNRRLEANQTLVQQNESLTKRLNAERIERQRAINKFIFDQCRQGESRDTVIVQQNRALLALLNQIPASQRNLFIDKLIQSLQDTNNLLEPPNELSCTPPAAENP